MTSGRIIGAILWFAGVWGMDCAHAMPAPSMDGPAYLVKNINRTADPSGSSNPRNFALAGSTVFFVATDAANPAVLWRTDGTTGGTEMLRDAAGEPVQTYLGETQTAAIGNVLFFLDTAGAPWKSDGTSRGTVRIADAQVGELATAGGGLYLTIGTALWKSGGTAGDLQLLADFPVGDSMYPYAPYRLFALGEQLLFVGYDAEHGLELWRSDGTSTGTQLVRDIRPGPENGMESRGDLPPERAVVDGVLYFLADDGSSGLELWRSDGTTAGTWRVKDILPGPDSAFYPAYDYDAHQPAFAAAGHGLFFIANDGVAGYELWHSDGTEAGTHMVTDLVAGDRGLYDLQDQNDEADPWPPSRAVIGETLYFASRTLGHDDMYQLWRSDGTAGGTVLLEDSAGGSIAAVGEALYLSRYNGERVDRELRRRLPADAASILVADVDGYIGDMWAAGRGLAFAVGDDRVGKEPWWSDGTAGGTYLLRDIRTDDAGSSPRDFTELNGMIVFTADDGIHGRELWRSDGTDGGTVLVADVNPGGLGSDPRLLIRFGDVLVFVADDGTHGRELWRTDGTAAGTALVRDVHSGSGASDPAPLTIAGDTVFFFADDGTHGRELWATDGTAQHTRLVSDLLPGPVSGGAAPPYISGPLAAPLGSAVIFGASDVPGRIAVWRSDGTEAGTRKIGMVPTEDEYDFPNEFVSIGAQVIFRTGDYSSILWRTDGTAEALVPLRQFPYVHGPGVVIDAAVFFAVESQPDGPSRDQIWRTDGTSFGTVPVATDLGDDVYELLNVRSTLVARLGYSYGELWRPELGTFFQGDVIETAVVEDHLIFTDEEAPWRGKPLWISDGTYEGTSELQDLPPPAHEWHYNEAEPAAFTAASGVVYFSADAGDTGRELWAVPVSALPDFVVIEPTPTDTAEATATVAPTETPVPTEIPTPCTGSQCVHVLVESATGHAGEDIRLQVRFHAVASIAAGVQTDLRYSADTPLAPTSAGRPDCQPNAAINKETTVFAFLPIGCTPGHDCTAVRAVVLSLVNIDPIPDGAVLFTCRFTIQPRTRPGVYPVSISTVEAADSLGREVGVTAVDGSIVVSRADLRYAAQPSGGGCEVGDGGQHGGVGVLTMALALWLARASMMVRRSRRPM